MAAWGTGVAAFFVTLLPFEDPTPRACWLKAGYADQPISASGGTSPDGGTHVGFGLGGPHGSVAVGDLLLDHAGSQLALRAVVGGIHLARMFAEGQKLASGPVDFGLQVPCQWTTARGGDRLC